MSSRATESVGADSSATRAENVAPSASGLLRLAFLRLRAEMDEIVRDAGYDIVSFSSVNLFRFGGPDGRRPNEIAEIAGLSKQAVNDQLSRLESEGYVKRLPDPRDGRARLVRLTPRGHELETQILAAAREVELRWAERIGPDRWPAFREVLEEMTDGQVPTPGRAFGLTP